ncbi:hypothetical protein LJB42_001735 [Komagataella kurtzmanii]|nr:hypothetical protein LJB42_001735 [Komagataella kurtzmanii]
MSQQEILQKNYSTPLHLQQVDIVGGEGFNALFFKNLLNPLLSNSDLTVSNFVQSSNEVIQRLNDTEVFNTSHLEVVEASAAADEHSLVIEGQTTAFKRNIQQSQLKPLPVKAILTLRPSLLKHFTVTPVLFENGIALNGIYSNLNAFGNSESLSFNGLVDLRSESPLKNFNFNFQAPLKDPSYRLVFNSLLSKSTVAWASNHEQTNSSVYLGLHKRFGRSLTSELGFSGVHRNVYNLSDFTSDTIKSDASFSNKNSLLLNVNYDSRSFTPESLYKFPTKGLSLTFNNELIIDQEKEQFSKSDLKFQSLYSFFNNWLTFEVAGGIGSIILNDTSKKPHFQDKFFLGGFNSLRGFKFNSTGLKDGNDFVGGTNYFQLGATAYSKIPFVKASPLRLRLFINAGDVINDIPTLKNTNFIKNSAQAVGWGLTYSLGSVANAEFNYNIPISTRTQDITKPGIEFALSLSGDFN